MRFYLIDKVVNLVLGDYAEGIKCVTKSEDYLEQHFPEYPVMPGVLIIESMAQLSGYLLSRTKESKKEYVIAILSMVEKAKFYKMVCPGEQIIIKSRIEKEEDESAFVRAKALVEGNKVAEANLLFTFFPINAELADEKVGIHKRMLERFEYTKIPFIRG